MNALVSLWQRTEDDKRGEARNYNEISDGVFNHLWQGSQYNTSMYRLNSQSSDAVASAWWRRGEAEFASTGAAKLFG